MRVCAAIMLTSATALLCSGRALAQDQGAPASGDTGHVAPAPPETPMHDMSFREMSRVMEMNDAAALGKQTGQDAALGKTTFVTQLGIDGAKKRVRDLLARADSALSIFGAKGEVLRATARFVAERKS